jgi:hypothetical protein
VSEELAIIVTTLEVIAKTNHIIDIGGRAIIGEDTSIRHESGASLMFIVASFVHRGNLLIHNDSYTIGLYIFF